MSAKQTQWRAAWSLAGCWLVYLGDQMITLKGGADSEAEAKLIAAAPDLLAACEAVIATHAKWMAEDMKGCNVGESECIGICGAAIAKATGSAS